MMTTSGKIIATMPHHAAAIEGLLTTVFGAGRLTRAAERLREGNRPIAALAHVLTDKAENVLASIAYWPIRVGADNGLLLGPLVVSPLLQKQGIGVELMRHTLMMADALPRFQFVLLVGDLPYYQRVDFVPAPPDVIMPAPVDTTRVLVRGAAALCARLSGAVCPAPDLC